MTAVKSRQVPLNEHEAAQAIEQVESPEVRRLLQMAVAQAKMQLVNSSDANSDISLPEFPFDLAFMVRVLREAYRNPQALRQILDGKSIAEATGWDV